MREAFVRSFAFAVERLRHFPLENLRGSMSGYPVSAAAGHATVARSGRRSRALIPPRRDARVWRHGNRQGPRLQRDEHLRRIRQVGRRRWRLESGYSRRSLAETAFGRLKGIFGDRLRSRVFASQMTEGLLRVRALNLMTMLGMPDSHPVNN